MKDNRHLAAIFFSDMVGYSAATHKNEDLALELLTEHRNILRPLIAKYEGREVKTMGDGFLVEFGTARAATMCAIEAQQAHLERNKKSPPERQVWIRIGVHLGEVVMEGEDVFGDGVNIAARLMQIARPGRICVSSPVMDQVRTHLDRWVTRIGRQRLKGISSDVFVFVIYPEYSKTEAPPASAKLLTMLKRRKRAVMVGTGAVALACLALLVGNSAWFRGISVQSFPRIAVLPLQGLGLQPSEGFIAEGLTDEIISSLARVKSIRVLSRNSSFRFGANGENLLAKAAELQLSGYVEGSVQKIGDHLRIHVGMTDAKTQENLWSKDFEGTLDGAFATQKEVAHAIAQQFLQFAKPKEADSLEEFPETDRPNQDAYLHYLKGLQLMRSRTEVGLTGALREFQAAAKGDPKFASAQGYMANVYILLSFYGFMDPIKASREGREAATKALELDPQNAYALTWFGEDFAYDKYEWTKADEFYERAIAANPSLAIIRQWYGEKLVYMGRFAEASHQLERARDLDPLSSVVVTASALVDFFRGDYDRALATYRVAADLDPMNMLPHLWSGKAYLEKKEYQHALESFRKAESLSEHSSLLEAFQAHTILLMGDRAEGERRVRGLLERSKLEHVSHYSLAHLFLALGQTDRAFEELNTAMRERDGRASAILVDPIFTPLRGDPRYAMLLRQMGLSTAHSRHK